MECSDAGGTPPSPSPAADHVSMFMRNASTTRTYSHTRTSVFINFEHTRTSVYESIGLTYGYTLARLESLEKSTELKTSAAAERRR